MRSIGASLFSAVVSFLRKKKEKKDVV